MKLFGIVAGSLLASVCCSSSAQMHKVAKPDQVTRAVGVYEYVGDLTKPRAARLIPVSLFIGGHFEDAAVYLARPIPFALDTGLRYELMDAGVRKQLLDLVAARNFAGSSAAAATPFDDGWFGYGRVLPLPVPKMAKLRPNCGNARVVEEVDSSRPHFGSKPAAEDAKPVAKGVDAKDDPCRMGADEDAPEKVTLDEGPKDKNSPDPERPTLHRSPESTANNAGASGKADKKAQKPVAATVTANSAPGDDADRPMIRHREAAEDDPNALPPDPIDLASKEAAAKASGKPAVTAAGPAAVAPSGARTSPATSNDTVAAEGTITAGDTMGGGPVLRRGKLTQPKEETAVVAAPARAAAGKPTIVAAAAPSGVASRAIAAPLEAIVAVSDAKDRAAHDYAYHFAAGAERAVALQALEAMAQAVLDKPALASDAADAPAVRPAAAKAAPVARGSRPAVAPVGTPASRARARAAAAKAAAASSAAAGPGFADEQMNAFQLYYGAPVSYTFTARVPATAAAPERYVVVVATTNADGKIEASFRSVTDAAHLDRIPRYRLIDAVDADGSNRAELLMELRAQRTRQFALYRLLGNKPDQVFVSGSTLL